MPTYMVSKMLRLSTSVGWQGQITDKAAQVCRMFGLTADKLAERCVTHNCSLDINNGDIVYITGPSGAGKSVLLRELEQFISESDRINLAQIESTCGGTDKTLIDCIDGDFLTSLKILSLAGLNDVFCILNRVDNLSDGQKYRFYLAMALAAKKKFVFADEFCSNLDRITAAVISFNVQKFAKRTGTVFILASSHDDLLLDLQPDVLVVKELPCETKVIYKVDQHHNCAD
jgi:ABC-type ATPase with predicted acetyltransferase domain